MQTADFNHQDFEQSKQNEQDQSLLVKFFTKQVQDKAKSKEEGRPIFKDVEYVDIRIPGNRTGGACRPATYRDKQRFPRHYEAFEKRVEMPTQGTPLIEWPLITRSQAEELAFFNVKTVEQLIDMPDGQASQFMGMQGLKQKAKHWLEESSETALHNTIEALKEENQSKDDRILSLETQMQELMARFESEEEPKSSKADVLNEEVQKPTRGRRKKTA